MTNSDGLAVMTYKVGFYAGCTKINVNKLSNVYGHFHYCEQVRYFFCAQKLVKDQVAVMEFWH